MTDQEKDKLIILALGIEWSYPKWRAATRWARFGIMWDRAQKMEWWDKFWGFIMDKTVNEKIKLPDYADFCFTFYYIHPTRLRDALAEFLEGRK